MFRLVLATILAMCCASSSFAYTQSVTVWAKADAATQLPAMQIEGQGIEAFFSDLSLTYDIPIALEIASNNDELATYRTDFNGGTLSEFMLRFVAQHQEYTWTINEGVLKILPKEKYRDPIFKELLGTQLKTFSISEKTSCWALEDALVSTPAVKKTLDAHSLQVSGRNFSGAYLPQLGRNFRLDIANTTLESLLNTVIKQSPVARMWFIKRHSYDRTLAIRFDARHEDAPSFDSRAIRPE
jgi:hypothetical protein